MPDDNLKPIPPGEYLITMVDMQGAFTRCTIAKGPHAGREVFIPRVIVVSLEESDVFINGQVAYPKQR